MANNRRKSAAIALAVIGIAGLSLASASQLTVTPTTSRPGRPPSASAHRASTSPAPSLAGTGYVADDVYV